MVRCGPSWWYAYSNGGAVGRAADRLNTILFVVAAVLCMSAPFFTKASLSRKCLLSVLAVVSTAVAFYLSSFLVLLIYGV
jgi:hypothetical protein